MLLGRTGAKIPAAAAAAPAPAPRTRPAAAQWVASQRSAAGLFRSCLNGRRDLMARDCGRAKGGAVWPATGHVTERGASGQPSAAASGEIKGHETWFHGRCQTQL